MNFFRREDPEIAAKIKAATEIRMDEAARERTRALLSEYVKMRPIRLAEPAPTPTPVYGGVLTFFMRHSMPVTVMALVLTISGSTAAAAESALPGETLYPIKIHVTEEVRATLALSPKAKADWEMSRAERRLEEAVILSLIGELNDDAREEIDTNLDAHVRSAGESRQKLEYEDNTSDASEVKEKIDAVLIARANILDKKLAVKTSADIEPAALSISMMSAPTASAEATGRASAQVIGESAAESKGHRTAAKVRIEATKKFLDRSAGSLTDRARKEAEGRLKQAEDSLSLGDTDDTQGNKSEASLHFDSALEVVTEIESIVSVPDESREQELQASTTDEFKNEVLNESAEDEPRDTTGGRLELQL